MAFKFYDEQYIILANYVVIELEKPRWLRVDVPSDTKKYSKKI